MIDPFQKKYHIMLFLYVIIKYDRIGGEKKKKKKDIQAIEIYFYISFTYIIKFFINARIPTSFIELFNRIAFT